MCQWAALRTLSYGRNLTWEFVLGIHPPQPLDPVRPALAMGVSEDALALVVWVDESTNMQQCSVLGINHVLRI